MRLDASQIAGVRPQVCMTVIEPRTVDELTAERNLQVMRRRKIRVFSKFCAGSLRLFRSLLSSPPPPPFLVPAGNETSSRQHRGWGQRAANGLRCRVVPCTTRHRAPGHPRRAGRFSFPLRSFPLFAAHRE